MLFSFVKIALTLFFATQIASTGFGQEQSILTQSVYYDCGSWIFYENHLQNLLSAEGMDPGRLAKPFIELLYDLEMNYWSIVIPYKLSTPKSSHHLEQGSIFYLIIRRLDQIIDVVAEMSNGHYIKCKRVDESTPESWDIGQNSYGYECGHDFFSHETVKMSATLAHSIRGRHRLYPTPYVGPLYLPKLNYWIYPISREKKFHQTGRMPEVTYFVVISTTGEPINVIAKLMRGGFAECVRTTKLLPVDESDKELRFGYTCGLEFLEINHMKRTAKLAKVRRMQQDKQVFPKEYNDDSSEGFMYPLFPNGIFYGTVFRPFKYYLVMNKNFEIKFAAVKTPKGITPCEESMRGIEAAPRETDDFICAYYNTEIKNEVLLQIIEKACQTLGTRSRKFPAIYNGPLFDIQGPYVTYPIRPGRNEMGAPNRYRVVMNTECKLAGVIVSDGKKFYKCRRSKDNSIPGGESEIPITETFTQKCRNRRKKVPVDPI